ncbi:MAG: M28 family peptidase [Candidatus Lokiarchaeota archaeon]|nr:M28 family peptidase [Candidatus Lokiarchaeota archaeon]
MSIDENNAYEITEKLSFPRLAGSDGEKKAIKIIIEEFRKAGYDDVKREPFKTSLFNWKLAEYFFLAASVMIIILALSFYTLPLISTLLSGVMLVSMFTYLGVISNPKIRLFRNDDKNIMTENLYTELKSNDPHANVVILAHHDTKSQTFPSYIRMILIIIVVFAGFILFILYLVLSLLKIFFILNFLIVDNILFTIAVIIASLACANFFNKTGNKSPGSTDNATSVGTVLELSNYYRKNPIKQISLTFLITGSEELNLGGAYDFITKHENKYDKKTTFFINFDLVGSTGPIFIISAQSIPKKVNNSRLIEYYIKAGEMLELEVQCKYIPTGSWGDHEPIIKQGFEACFVGSRGCEKKVHTKYDTMDLVSREGLHNILVITTEVIKMISEDFI